MNVGGLLRQALVLVAAASAASAQVTTATLYGIVTDSSGATIPAAAITVTNDATSIQFRAKTDETGEFAVTNLPVGTYSLLVEAQGFKTQRQVGLQLTTGQRQRLTLQMEVGNLAETVTVTAEAPLVNTATAEQRNTVSTLQAQELPLSRRNWTGVLNLNTGVEGMRMNGLPGAGFRFTVDGTDAEGDPEFPSISMYLGFNFIQAVSLEAISEVNVTKGIAPAEIANTMSGASTSPLAAGQTSTTAACS